MRGHDRQESLVRLAERLRDLRLDELARCRRDSAQTARLLRELGADPAPASAPEAALAPVQARHADWHHHRRTVLTAAHAARRDAEAEAREAAQKAFGKAMVLRSLAKNAGPRKERP
jgi:hypothetical protein